MSVRTPQQLARHPTDAEIVCPALLPPPPALQAGDLPAAGTFPAGVYPGSNIDIFTNNTPPNQQSWFPQQYWPNEYPGTTGPPNLNCTPGAGTPQPTFQPTIDFVATQFQTQVRQSTEPAHNSPYCQDQDTTGSPNLCVQMFNQLPQTELNTWQPPLPLTIVGQGFGYLSGLPWAGASPTNPCSSPVSPLCYVVIEDNEARGGNWTTASGTCEVYISDWTDGSISLQVGLPVNQTDGSSQSVVLSPLTDFSPWTVFQPTAPYILPAASRIRPTKGSPPGTVAVGKLHSTVSWPAGLSL